MPAGLTARNAVRITPSTLTITTPHGYCIAYHRLPSLRHAVIGSFCLLYATLRLLLPHVISLRDTYLPPTTRCRTSDHCTAAVTAVAWTVLLARASFLTRLPRLPTAAVTTLRAWLH